MIEIVVVILAAIVLIGFAITLDTLGEIRVDLTEIRNSLERIEKRN